MDGKTWVRRVDASGRISVGDDDYFISQTLAKQDVVVRMEASARELVIYYAEQEYRRHALRGMVAMSCSFDQFVEQVCATARGEDARIRDRQRRRQP